MATNDGVPNAWLRVLNANGGYAPAQDYSPTVTSTLYGTMCLPPAVITTFRDACHLTLPRNPDDADPNIIKLLRPYL